MPTPVTVATFVLARPLWTLMHHPDFALILTGQIGFDALMGPAAWAGRNRV